MKQSTPQDLGDPDKKASDGSDEQLVGKSRNKEDLQKNSKDRLNLLQHLNLERIFWDWVTQKENINVNNDLLMLKAFTDFSDPEAIKQIIRENFKKEDADGIIGDESIPLYLRSITEDNSLKDPKKLAYRRLLYATVNKDIRNEIVKSGVGGLEEVGLEELNLKMSTSNYKISEGEIHYDYIKDKSPQVYQLATSGNVSIRSEQQTFRSQQTILENSFQLGQTLGTEYQNSRSTSVSISHENSTSHTKEKSRGWEASVGASLSAFFGEFNPAINVGWSYHSQSSHQRTTGTNDKKEDNVTQTGSQSLQRNQSQTLSFMSNRTNCQSSTETHSSELVYNLDSNREYLFSKDVAIEQKTADISFDIKLIGYIVLYYSANKGLIHYYPISTIFRDFFAQLESPHEISDSPPAVTLPISGSSTVRTDREVVHLLESANSKLYDLALGWIDCLMALPNVVKRKQKEEETSRHPSWYLNCNVPKYLQSKSMPLSTIAFKSAIRLSCACESKEQKIYSTALQLALAYLIGPFEVQSINPNVDKDIEKIIHIPLYQLPETDILSVKQVLEKIFFNYVFYLKNSEKSMPPFVEHQKLLPNKYLDNLKERASRIVELCKDVEFKVFSNFHTNAIEIHLQKGGATLLTLLKKELQSWIKTKLNSDILFNWTQEDSINWNNYIEEYNEVKDSGFSIKEAKEKGLITMEEIEEVANKKGKAYKTQQKAETLRFFNSSLKKQSPDKEEKITYTGDVEVLSCQLF